MTADEFVGVVDLVVRRGSISSTLKNLEHPPGRNPDAELRSLADWFNRLGVAERKAVAGVARLAVSHAACAFLSVIDGAMAIESGPERGHLELYYVNGGERRLLNDPRDEPLNDKLH